MRAIEMQRLFRFAAWANILTLVLTAVGLSYQIHDVKQVAIRTADVLLGSQLHISYPTNGSVVGRTAEVRGFTPFPQQANYLVVSLPAGDFIQEGPLKVSPSGLWVGIANFGNASAGAGLVFTVRVFHTHELLPPGFQTLPADSGFSEPISVLRKE